MKKTTLLLFTICCFTIGKIAAQAEFITTWKTDNPGLSADNAILIPIGTTGTFNYTVDWGDGTTDMTVYTSSAPHTYATSGTYTVTISGDFPHMEWQNTVSDNDKLLSVEQWGTQQWTSMKSMFWDCDNMVSNATDIPDLSLVTDMSWMFREASSFNQPLNSWDVNNVSNMQSMFAGASTFNQNLGGWNVSNVTDMSFMFNNAASFNQNIGNWNVSNVTDMSFMYWYATSFNQDLGNWNLSSITAMPNMFLFVTLSLANYDNTLIGWNTLDAGETQIPSGISFHGGNSVYCNGETARTNLINSHGWTITDFGLDCSTLSVTDFDTASISLFPNPVKSSFTIKGLNNDTYNLQIVNLQGQIIKELPNYNTEAVSMETLANGVYFVKINTNNSSKTLRVIKSN